MQILKIGAERSSGAIRQLGPGRRRGQNIFKRSKTYEVTTPFVEDYRTTGDAATFEQAYTNFFRAFTEPVL